VDAIYVDLPLFPATQADGDWLEELLDLIFEQRDILG
jgi:hypothetical protein